MSFDVRETFLLPNVEFGKNIIEFSANVSSSVHVNNKRRHLNCW